MDRYFKISLEEVDGTVINGEYNFDTGLRASDIVYAYIKIILPNIPSKENFEYSWPRNVGYMILRKVRFFQTNYPENYLDIFGDDLLLSVEFLSRCHKNSMDKMLGNINELTLWSKNLPFYSLFIPIHNNFDEIREKFKDELISIKFELIQDTSTILRIRPSINDNTPIPLGKPRLYIKHMVNE